MFANWFILTALICATIYLVVMLFYYKTLLNKEKTSKDFIKNNLDDTEIVAQISAVKINQFANINNLPQFFEFFLHVYLDQKGFE